ncbi:hypothetical protein EON63_21910 [archaeon]|nr:MAG: hypothetical protein EON63_21910 [archaeon]
MHAAHTPYHKQLPITTHSSHPSKDVYLSPYTNFLQPSAVRMVQIDAEETLVILALVEQRAHGVADAY